VGGDAFQRFLVVVVHLELGDRILLLGCHAGGEDPLLGGEPADEGAGRSILGQPLGKDVAGPVEGRMGVRHPLFRVDEGEGGLFRRAGLQLLQKDQLGQRFQSPLPGNGRLGAALRLVGEVEVLQHGLLPAGLDFRGQLRGQLPLLGDGGKHGLLAAGKLGVVFEQVGQIADLHFVQLAGLLLAVTGDEGDGCPLLEELDGAPHLAGGEA